MGIHAAKYLLDDATMLPSGKMVADRVWATAEIAAAIAALVASSPAALDTLDELAAALGDDANFAATVTNAIAAKLAMANNLSDLANAGTARTNLGLGSAATVNLGANVATFLATPTLPNLAAVLDLPAANQYLYSADADVHHTIAVTATGSNVNLVANRLYKIPVVYRKTRVIPQLTVVVATGAAGNLRIGLRAANQTTGAPTTLVVDAGAVDTTASGVKTLGSLNVQVTPGLYYYELLADNTAAIRAGTALNIIGSQFVGTNVTHVCQLYRNYSYGALPAGDESGQSFSIGTAGSFFVGDR